VQNAVTARLDTVPTLPRAGAWFRSR